MLLPLGWLKDYVDINVTREELKEKLFSIGFEVEDVIRFGEKINGVVAGLLTEKEKISDTNIWACNVDCGDYGQIKVCCSASNLCVGEKYPVALCGGTVYALDQEKVATEKTITINKANVCGYVSQGMICSEAELGYGQLLPSGLQSTEVLTLEKNIPLGRDVKEYIGLDEYIFDVAITANRPDCQSILGLAREIAAVLGVEIKQPSVFSFDSSGVLADYSTYEKWNGENCSFFAGAEIKGDMQGFLPFVMRARLYHVGIQPKGNITDVCSYVLKEIGQPINLIDSSKINVGKMHFSLATDKIDFILEDGQKRGLTNSPVLYMSEDKVVGVAGIINSPEFEVTSSTEKLFVSVAKLARDKVRRTSRELGIRTNESVQYEKGTDAYTANLALLRFLLLVQQYHYGAPQKGYFNPEMLELLGQRREVVVSFARIEDVLGIHIPMIKAIDILKKLEFQPECVNSDEILVKVPQYREDVEGVQDIAEELIRFYGYENIVPTFLNSAKVTFGGLTEDQRNLSELKKLLCYHGCYESISYSFFSEKDLDMLGFPEEAPERNAIRIINPISADLSIMRTTLVPSMINAVVRNYRRGVSGGRLFECANIFSNSLGEPEEKQCLAIALFGDGEDFWATKTIFESISKIIGSRFKYVRSTRNFLHPGQSADIIFDGKEIGYFGRVSYPVLEKLSVEKPVYVGQIEIFPLLKYMKHTIKYTPIPSYPILIRDLSFIVEEDVPCSEIEEMVFEKYSNISLFLTDVYSGAPIADGKKSLTFRLEFGTNGKQCSSKEVDIIVEDIVDRAKSELKAEFREV